MVVPGRDIAKAHSMSRETSMPFSIPTFADPHLRDVFGEKRDPARRRAAIDEIWNEEGVFLRPKFGRGPTVGRTEDRIGPRVPSATHPEFSVQRFAEPEELGNGGRVQWVFGAALVDRHRMPD